MTRARFVLLGLVSLSLGLTASASAGTLLTLSKTDSPDPVAAGAQLTYTVTFANIGTTSATNVRLRDPVAANTSFAAASCSVAGSTCSLSVGVVTCLLGTLAPSAGGTCTLAVNVNAPLVDGTILSDVATITDAEGESVDAGASTTVTSSPNLILSNSATPDPVLASELLTNTVLLKNTGNETATGVTVTHTLDSNTTFVSATCTATGSVCTPAAGTVTCTVGSVTAPVGAVTCTLVSQVAFPLADGTIVHQCADATSNEGSALQACSATTVQAANLMLGVSDSTDPVAPGDEIHLRLRFANRRSTNATNVSIAATLPAGTTLGVASDGGSLVGSTVTWALGILPGGTSGAVDLSLVVDGMQAPGPLSLSATITDMEGDSTTTVESTGVAAAPVLDITISDSADPVAAGGTLTSTIRVSNRGSTSVAGLKVTIPDPTRAAIVSLGPVPPIVPNPCVHSAPNRNTVCTLGATSLGIAETRTVQLVATIDASQPLGSLDLVRATATDGAGDQADAVSYTLIDGTGTVTLTKVADFDPVQVGSSIVYTLHYTTTASGIVTIRDALPAEVAYVSASATCTPLGSTCTCDTPTCDATSTFVTCTIPAVPPPSNGTCTVAVAGVVGRGKLILNSGLAVADGHSAEATAVSLALANQPLSKLTVSDYPDPVPITFRGAPGQITYSVHYQNVGNDVLKAVVIKTRTPTRTLFVSASAPLDPALKKQPVVGKPARIQWKIGDVAPGAGGDLSLVVSLKTRVSVGWTIRNAVAISAAGSFTDQVRLFTTVGAAR